MARHNGGARLKLNQFGIYEVHWTANGKPHKRSLGTSDKATAETRILPYRIATPEALAVKKVTVNDAFATYIAEAKVKRMGLIERVKTLIAPFLGKMLISDIRPIHVNAYTEWAQKNGRAYGSVDGDIKIVKRVINYMFKTRRVPPGTEKPVWAKMAPPQPRRRWLTQAQFERWITFLVEWRKRKGANFPDRLTRLERLSWIAAQTGARRANIEALKWEHVDFKARIIHFQELTGEVATNKKKASVPINKKLLPVLEQAFRERDSEYVLDNPYPITGQWIEANEAYCEAANEDRFNPHDLRRSFGSWLLQNKVSVYTVAQLLGNSVAQIEKVYGILAQDTLRDAVEMVDKIAA